MTSVLHKRITCTQGNRTTLCARRVHPPAHLPGRFARSPHRQLIWAQAAGAAQTAAPGSSQGSHQGMTGNGAQPADSMSGPMLEPNAFNKNWVRLGLLIAAVVLAARSTEFVPVNVAAFIHVISWGVWLGSNVWTTFVAGITMFKSLPRQTFGRLQAKLFPKYFAVAVMTGILQLGTLAFGVQGGIAKAQLLTLGSAVAASLANWLYVEPVATNLMFERYNLENAEGEKDSARIKELYKSFGKLHGISSLLNLAALVAVVSHGWWLASRLTLSVA